MLKHWAKLITHGIVRTKFEVLVVGPKEDDGTNSTFSHETGLCLP